MPTRHGLIETTPEEALDLFLQERSTESADSTIQSYRYRLQHFVRWCDGVAEVDNLNDLSGRDLHKYKLWRQEDGDLNKTSLKAQLESGIEPVDPLLLSYTP